MFELWAENDSQQLAGRLRDNNKLPQKEF